MIAFNTKMKPNYSMRAMQRVQWIIKAISTKGLNYLRCISCTFIWTVFAATIMGCTSNISAVTPTVAVVSLGTSSSNDVQTPLTTIADAPQLPASPVLPTSTLVPASKTPGINDNEGEKPAITLTPSPSIAPSHTPRILEWSFQLAFLREDPGPSSTAGVYNTSSETMDMVAEPGIQTRLGRLLWSPSRDFLAFARHDTDTAESYIEILAIENKESLLLETAKPQNPEEQSDAPGLFLYGWSSNSEWLAYSYLYDSVAKDLYLINRLTGENIRLALTNPVFWFEWSSHNLKFAFTDDQSVYTGSLSSPTTLTEFRHENELGLVRWYPESNILLINGGTNVSVEGFNQLWQLDLDTEEWQSVGSYSGIYDFAVNQDEEIIALYTYNLTSRRSQLVIINSNTLQSMDQLSLPSVSLFDLLGWLDNETMAMSSGDNMYVVSIVEPTGGQWVLVPNNPLHQSNSLITDWQGGAVP